MANNNNKGKEILKETDVAVQSRNNKCNKKTNKNGNRNNRKNNNKNRKEELM